jgi:hypothetical protein
MERNFLIRKADPGQFFAEPLLGAVRPVQVIALDSEDLKDL